MNWKTIVITILVIAAAAFFIVKKKMQLSPAPVVGEKPVLVTVTPLREETIRQLQDYLARVEPFNQARIASRLTAAVEKVLVDEGSRVQPGDLLIELDQKDLRAKLSSGRAALASARENLSYWQKEYDRDEALFQEGASSEEARDRSKNSLAQARGRVESAEGQINQIQSNLAYARITSPYAGVVSRRYVDPGDLAAPGKPLLLVEDRSSLKLAFSVPQEDAHLLKIDQPVTYYLNGQRRQARITDIFPSLEDGKVLRVEADINSETELLVGSFIPVQVLVREKNSAVVVPRSALAGPDESRFIFLVEDGHLRRQPVKIGLQTEDTVEVTNIQPPARVVTNPYLSWINLAAGQAVRIRKSK